MISILTLTIFKVFMCYFLLASLYSEISGAVTLLLIFQIEKRNLKFGVTYSYIDSAYMLPWGG